MAISAVGKSNPKTSHFPPAGPPCCCSSANEKANEAFPLSIAAISLRGLVWLTAPFWHLGSGHAVILGSVQGTWCAETRIASHACSALHPPSAAEEESQTSDVKKAAHCVPFYSSRSSCRGRSYVCTRMPVSFPAGTAQADSGKTHRDPNRRSAASPMNDRHGHAMPLAIMTGSLLRSLSQCRPVLSTDGQDESPTDREDDERAPGLEAAHVLVVPGGGMGKGIHPWRDARRSIGRCNPERADQIWPALV